MFKALKRDRAFYGYLLRLTGPIALQNLITFSLGLIDTLMVSQLGNNEMAAVTAANVPVFLLISIVFGVQSGVGILISQYWGKKDLPSISRAIGVAAGLGVALALVIALALFLWPVQIMDLMSNKHHLSLLGAPYLRVIGFSYVFNMLSSIYVSAQRSVENASFGMKLFGMSTVLNTGMNYLLIFGKCGFPMLGVEGAAIATFISQLVGGVLPVFYFLNKRSTSSIHLGRAQWNGGVIRSACINGSSELMTNLSMSLVNILYNYQLLRFAGENGVAAYGVIMYAAFLFVAVFVGYAVGSAPIVSYHYGARNHAELNNLYSKSLRLIGVIAVVMTALSMLVIPYVARIFVGYDAELLALTSHAFRVYALNFFLMGFNVYGSSFFTALGDGVTSALISFLRTLLFQLLALIFLPMVLGIEGVWLAVTAAEAGALCVTVLMFITKDKVFHYRKASC